MGHFDYYSVVREIIDNLRNDGKLAWAEKLKDDMVAGATGTEILMALRWHLRQFVKQGHVVSTNTRNLINDIMPELDKELD
jgi:hypothetical protein